MELTGMHIPQVSDRMVLSLLEKAYRQARRLEVAIQCIVYIDW